MPQVEPRGKATWHSRRCLGEMRAAPKRRRRHLIIVIMIISWDI